MNDIVFTSNNYQQTQSFAQKFAKQLQAGDFLAFYGNLGSGKTTFIQGLAKGLGITRRIISPTFIIVRTYQLNKNISNFGLEISPFSNQDPLPNIFYHIDLYRTETKNDLLSVGIDQIIEDKNAIIALEWAEKMGELLPKKRYDIIFGNINESKRVIKIKKYG